MESPAAPVTIANAAATTVAKEEWALLGVWNAGPRLPSALQAKPADPPPKQAGAIRFVCLSDTHSYHGMHAVPDGDVFIHAGDWTRDGEQETIASFSSWLSNLPHKHKIVISGNHDLPMDPQSFGAHFLHEKLLKESLEVEKSKEGGGEKDAAWVKQKRQELVKELPRRSIALLRASCTYLVDESVSVEGIKIYGSPWVPGAKNWAYSLPRGSEELAAKWAKIPMDTTVLVTHGPPAGLDLPAYTTPLKPGYLPDPGCELLRDRSQNIKPLVHVCGHIHEHYGVYKQASSAVVINAAAVDARRAIVFDLCKPTP